MAIPTLESLEKKAAGKKAKAKKGPRVYTRFDPDTLEELRITRDDDRFDESLTPTQARAEKKRREKDEAGFDFGGELGKELGKEAGRQLRQKGSRKAITRIKSAAKGAAGAAIQKGAGAIGGAALGTLGLTALVVTPLAVGAWLGWKHKSQRELDEVAKWVKVQGAARKKQFGRDLNENEFRQLSEVGLRLYREKEAAEARRRMLIK